MLPLQFCPFAQRTAICLEEKKVPFHYKEVSLRDPSTGLWYPLGKKPDWFLELNPLGQACSSPDALVATPCTWCMPIGNVGVG